MRERACYIAEQKPIRTPPIPPADAPLILLLRVDFFYFFSAAIVFLSPLMPEVLRAAPILRSKRSSTTRHDA